MMKTHFNFQSFELNHRGYVWCVDIKSAYPDVQAAYRKSMVDGMESTIIGGDTMTAPPETQPDDKARDT